MRSMLSSTQGYTDQKMKKKIAKLMKKKKLGPEAIKTKFEEESQSSQVTELVTQSPEPKSPLTPSKINLLSNMK